MGTDPFPILVISCFLLEDWSPIYRALVNVLIIHVAVAKVFDIGIPVSLASDNCSCDHLTSFGRKFLLLSEM